MSIYEYNEEEHMRMEREDAYADGHKDGFKDGSLGMKKEMMELIRVMTEAGMHESLPSMAEDEAFLEEMMERFQIK